MSKIVFDWQKAVERENEIKVRFREMAESLEKDEQREDYTDAEKEEQRELNRELAILRGQMIANTKNVTMRSMEEVKDINDQMRETLKEGKRFEITIKRENVIKVADAVTGGMVPLTIEDIVKPLYPKTIMSLLGIPFRTGLTGDHQWPVIETVEAALAEEGVELGDTKIPASKLKANPQRMGITIPITSQAINRSNGLLQTVIKESMPEAIVQLMNKIEFSPVKVNENFEIAGPFVSPKAGHSVEYVGTTYNEDAPTYQEMMNLVGIVADTNVVFDGTEAFVMTAGMYYMLKATPRAEGQMGFIIDDNDRIGGIPVFKTPYIGQKTIGFGVWHYNPAALFGDFRLVADPYTGATKDQVRFTLNVDFDTTVLRKEAFAIMRKHVAANNPG